VSPDYHSDACLDAPRFDPSTSTTFGNSNISATINYGNGAVQGTTVRDTVSMGR